MKHLYNFGISQEDERTEAAALEPGCDDRVLCVASAGDMPLSLLALGAGEVHAVDIDDSQLELTRLKLAAVCALSVGNAARFLGFRSATAQWRRERFEDVAQQLTPDSATFWRSRLKTVENGAIWAGRFERYVRRLAPLLLALVGRRRVAAFFASLAAIALAVWAGFRAGSEGAGVFGLLVPTLAALAFMVLMTGDFGLRPVPTNLWGGLMVTLVVAVSGIAASLPLGV